MNKLLKLSNVSKSFDTNRIIALKKISFECNKGDVISIIGNLDANIFEANLVWRFGTSK